MPRGARPLSELLPVRLLPGRSEISRVSLLGRSGCGRLIAGRTSRWGIAASEVCLLSGAHNPVCHEAIAPWDEKNSGTDLMRRKIMETDTLEKIFREHPFFKDIEAHHLRTIIECATIERFEPGDVIFREGEPAHSFYLIRTGKVALQLVSYRAEPFTVLTLDQGEIIGSSWLFPPYRWKLTATALEVARVISIDGAKLRARCEADHDLGYALMKQFAQIIGDRFDALSEHFVEVGPLQGKLEDASKV